MFRVLFFISLLFFILVYPFDGQCFFEYISPGSAHIHEISPEPWDIYLLIVDIDDPSVRLKSVVKNDTMKGDAGETVSSMAIRHGALAGVNTDYFNMSANRHEPQGWTMTDGMLQFVPSLNRPIIEGRPSLIISKNGFPRISIPTNPEEDWYNVASGMPRLVVNGAIIVSPSETRHPRTAVGISQDGSRLFLMAVDGRQACSKGMSLFETGIYLWKLGAWNAMNFDGGGSTTMFVNGRIVNHPSDGRERKVAGSLLLIRR